MATNPYFINARQLDSNGVWQDVVITISPATLSSGILQTSDSSANADAISDAGGRLDDIEAVLEGGVTTTVTTVTALEVVAGIVTAVSDE